MGGSKEITSLGSNDYRNLFASIDVNRDNAITAAELQEKPGNITAGLIPFTEKLSSVTKDNNPLELWQYLRSVNDFVQEEVFTPEQLRWADKNYALQRIFEDARDYQRIDPLLKTSHDLACAALAKDIRSFSFISEELKDNKLFLAEAVKYRPEIVELVDPVLFSDRSFVSKLLQNNGSAYKYLPQAHNDKELTLLAVSNYGFALQHTAPELQQDIDVVMSAVKNRGTALRFAPELNDDFEIVAAAIDADGSSLEFASQRLRNNIELARKAVQQDGVYLKYSGPIARADLETVMTAVSDQGIALGLAAPELKDDQTVVAAAVENNAFALYYASERLKNDREFIRHLFTLNWNLLLKEKVRSSYVGDKRVYPNPCYEIAKNSLAPETVVQYENIIQQLLDLDIEHYQRFKNMDDAIKIIENRRALPVNLSEKHAVIIYPKYDGSGAFESNNSIHQLLENSYDVYYFEISEDQDIEMILASLSNRKQTINFLTLGGHGVRTHLSFGAHDPAISKKGKELYYLDTGDNEKINIAPFLRLNARIFLESCSSGQGADKLPNVANTVDHISGYKCDIFAPQFPTRIKGYIFNENAEVTGIEFSIGAENSYFIDN